MPNNGSMGENGAEPSDACRRGPRPIFLNGLKRGTPVPPHFLNGNLSLQTASFLKSPGPQNPRGTPCRVPCSGAGANMGAKHPEPSRPSPTVPYPGPELRRKEGSLFRALVSCHHPRTPSHHENCCVCLSCFCSFFVLFPPPIVSRVYNNGLILYDITLFNCQIIHSNFHSGFHLGFHFEIHFV